MIFRNININTYALQVTQTAAGFTNYYWDYAQLVGATGVNVRAAGSIAMDSVYAQSNGIVNIQSGGNTTIAGNYSRFTVNNQGSGGWYQESALTISIRQTVDLPIEKAARWLILAAFKLAYGGAGGN